MTAASDSASHAAAGAAGKRNLAQRLCAEALGIAFLLATVVGSGIMGERLADGNTALALLGNTIATGVVPAVLIVIFGPISGAHFNPAVTLARSSTGTFSGILRLDAPAFVAAQFVGAVAATLLFGRLYGDRP